MPSLVYLQQLSKISITRAASAATGQAFDYCSRHVDAADVDPLDLTRDHAAQFPGAGQTGDAAADDRDPWWPVRVHRAAASAAFMILHASFLIRHG